MNAALAKAEETLADEPAEIRTDNSPAEDPAVVPESGDESLLSEAGNRRLYRRSVAYFLFGFGCNRHSIVTDEPSG